MTYKQSLRPAFYSPTRGVRAGIDEQGWWAELAAFTLVLPPEAVFSHTTAAKIQSLPLPKSDPRPFHVTCANRRGSRSGITWHARSVTGATDLWHGWPVTSPLRTWQDLGALLTLPQLVAMADVLLRRHICTTAELAALNGIRHRRRLAEAAALADGGSWSPRESILRVAMHDRGLPAPELNGHIVEQAVLLGTGDYVWRLYKVIADYDGDHHDHPRQRHQDAQTRDDYAAAGWRHVALTKQMSLDDAVGRVERALRQRGWVS